MILIIIIVFITDWKYMHRNSVKYTITLSKQPIPKQSSIPTPQNSNGVWQMLFISGQCWFNTGYTVCHSMWGEIEFCYAIYIQCTVWINIIQVYVCVCVYRCTQWMICMYLSNAKVCACVHAVVNKRREREKEGGRETETWRWCQNFIKWLNAYHKQQRKGRKGRREREWEGEREERRSKAQRY